MFPQLPSSLCRLALWRSCESMHCGPVRGDNAHVPVEQRVVATMALSSGKPVFQIWAFCEFESQPPVIAGQCMFPFHVRLRTGRSRLTSHMVSLCLATSAEMFASFCDSGGPWKARRLHYTILSLTLMEVTGADDWNSLSALPLRGRT